MNALAVLLYNMKPFNAAAVVQTLFVLVICGLVLWLIMKYVPMQPPFPQIIIVVVVLLLCWWLLTIFGII